MRLTWSTGAALETLLRCGLHNNKRVITAINTLFNRGEGYKTWCGCSYFDTKDWNFVKESSEPTDFNKSPVWEKNIPYSLDWFLPEDEISNLVCDNYHYLAMAFKRDQAFLAKQYHSTGECSMIIRRALTFHPKFAKSNFETNMALSLTYSQAENGSWGEAYLSNQFGLLERTSHPLSAFLVLRSIPLLIRDQGKDGFWQENQVNKCSPPKKEESTFLICRALKKFGFLKALLPK